ncbi:MAG: hypothetical protein K6B68_03740 [Eubacterium sp.]|nr:hypothetical protein [Eubacterium sp.]
MSKKSDEDVLYSCYMQLAEKMVQKNKKSNLKKDMNQIEIIEKKIPELKKKLFNMTNFEMSSSHKIFSTVKNYYLQYSSIKGRNPSCVNLTLSSDIDMLIRMLSKIEAKLLNTIRNTLKNGEYIDIQAFFKEKRNLNLLSIEVASQIVLETIGDLDTVYISKSGTHYHSMDCSYIKRRVVKPVKRKTLDSSSYLPCRCIDDTVTDKNEDSSYITAFIDESIHPVLWNHNGVVGRTGSYSYILCWGKLMKETQITEEGIIDKNVRYTDENRNVVGIAEAALSEVMIRLAYDYNYDKNLIVYTDNKVFSENWYKNTKNYKLSNLFQTVVVRYVPREQNSKADKLGRDRIILNLPRKKYEELVNKIDRLSELEEGVKVLEFA